MQQGCLPETYNEDVNMDTELTVWGHVIVPLYTDVWTEIRKLMFKYRKGLFEKRQITC